MTLLIRGVVRATSVSSESLFEKLCRLLALLLLTISFSFAQQAPSSATSLAPDSKPAPDQNSEIVVPAGTHIPLILTHPIDSKTIRPGDEIHAQATAPIPVDARVAIPAGTYLQAKLRKITRRGNRGVIDLQSASLILPGGYVRQITGPLSLVTDEGTVWRDPSGRAKTGAIIAPLAGAGLGALIGHAANSTQTTTFGGTTMTSSSLKGTAIGTAVGGGVGTVVALLLLTRSRDIYVDIGSSMQLTLPTSLSLPANEVSKALRQGQPPAVVIPAGRRIQPAPPLYDHSGICNTPDPLDHPGTTFPCQ